MQPDGDWLYVANSNADLRFNDGTLLVMNVGEDRTVATDSGPVTLRGAASDRARPSDWAVCPQQDYVNPLPRSTPPTCCWDALDSNILNCDERLYVQSDATVRIGSFAAGHGLAAQLPEPVRRRLHGGPQRLAPHRRRAWGHLRDLGRRRAGRATGRTPACVVARTAPTARWPSARRR